MTLQGNLFDIKNLAVDGEDFTYSIHLNRECFIYKAHFPGNPITPGVCILQIAAELLQERLQRHIELSVVNNVKFLSILSPIENAEVDYKFSGLVVTDEDIKVKVLVTKEEKTFAKTSLSFAK